jgi:transposase
MHNTFTALTDDQWILIQKLMDWTPPLERGKSRSNLRNVWNSIFYILTRGCRWSDLPSDRNIYAARATAHQWLLQWQHLGVFDRVLSGLLQLAAQQKKIDLTHILVDGSFSPCTWGRRRSSIWL